MPVHKNICIFGGSFNPVHYGHLRLAKAARDRIGFDEVWLMVSPQNPLKKNRELMPDDFRFAMVQKAVERYKGIVASDFEFGLSRPSFTWNTLQHLEQSFPNYSFSLLIGADNWHNFGLWKNHEQILERYRIIVYPRTGFPINDADLPLNVCVLDVERINISSTQIRSRLAEGKSVARCVPAAVARMLSDELSETKI